MSDSGKHSALRQTDDGSFELVLDREGLQEVSEEEVSLSEVSAPEPPPAARASNRVLMFTVAGVAVLLMAAAVGWYAISPSSSQTEGDTDEVTGFKPYVGGAESDSSDKNAARRARLAAIAGAEVEDAEEADEAEVEAVEVVEEVVEAGEITESEPGWELSEQAEDGVIVEVEGTDPVVEDEVAEADVVEVEERFDGDPPPTSANPSIMSGNRLDALRNANIGRNIQPPRVPALGAKTLGRKLPIRNLRPASTDDPESGGGVDEEYVDEEVVEEDEEFVEEDEIIEEELE